MNDVFLETLIPMCTLMYERKMNIKLVYTEIGLYRKTSLCCV